MHSHLFKIVNLYIHNLVRKTEFGYSIFQDTAYFVQGFENENIVALLYHVAGKTQSCGS